MRAGATLLYDSNPQEEEAETELKASAMLAAIREADTAKLEPAARSVSKAGAGLKILLVDHEDSFVHTLANYFRQTGAEVSTVRSPVAEETFDRVAPDLVVLSPGPGSPKDFDTKATIRKARSRDLPIFGVCLWPSGACGSLWRNAATTGCADARQTVTYPHPRARSGLCRTAGRDHGRSVSFHFLQMRSSCRPIS